MTLAQKREQWEQGLDPVIEIPGPSSFTVVLSDEDGNYHVHYYTQVGMGGWDVSADLQNGTSEEVVDALVRRYSPE